MIFEPAGMLGELRLLSKGEGIRSGSVQERIGPQLARVCEVTERDKLVTARRKVTTTIERLVRGYDVEEQTLVRALLGMHPEASHSTLGGRYRWLAGKLHCGERTVHRRADKAFKNLAGDAVAAARAAATAAEVGYVVEALKVEVVFAGDRIKVIGYRKIRATHARLDVIRWRFGLQRPSSGHDREFDLDIKVLDGGRLLGYERQRGEGNVIVCSLEPKKPIERDKTYDFKVSYLLPSEQPMPHYVVQPATVFESFDLTVRFDPSRLPSQVWRVDGVGHREIDVCPPHERVLPLGPSGELEVSFQGFDRGGSYGLAWR